MLAPLKNRRKTCEILYPYKFILVGLPRLVMNDLNTRACCHISDKIGRNEKQEQNCSCFRNLSLLLCLRYLFEFRINLQTISPRHFNHQVGALGCSTNPQNCITLFQ